MEREKPEGIPDELWAAFEEFADLEGIGTHPDDWKPWWDCYYAGVMFVVGSLEQTA